MSRVLIPHEPNWYDELKAVAYYGETDLEDSIRQHLISLFPDYYVFPFKKEVTSRTTGDVKKPDLAMIRRDFSAWGVIEVEIAEHEIKHVLEQTRVFVAGDYNAPEMADYIRRQLKTHCGKKAGFARLTDLLSAKLPSVLVITDTHVDNWQQQLEAAGVTMCVFEIYKSTRGRYVYRTSGKYPSVPAQEAHCRAAAIDNVIEVIGNFTFKTTGQNKEVAVSFDNRLTRWACFEDNQRRYLRFLGRANPLFPKDSYVIIADKTSRYHFKKI